MKIKDMHFRKFPVILAVFLLAVLFVQPVLSEDNLTGILTAENVATVTNQTPDLEKDPASYFYNWAERSLVSGDYEGAIKLYDQSLASNTTMLYKTDALLYLFRDKAYAQIQLKNYTGAVATLDAGLAIYPDDAMLWNNRGYAQYSLGKMQEALTAYDKSVSFDRNYTTAYINKGDTLSAMGRYSEAITAYSMANETDPFNIAASDGLEAARRGEAESGRNTLAVLAVVLVAAISGAVWYIRFRKPAVPEVEEGKKKSGNRK